MNSCASCTLLGRPRIKSRSGPNPTIMVVGEAPGQQEAERGIPFVGISGQELSMYLQRAGIDEADCYITNVVLCHPEDNRDPKPDEIACCRQRLLDDINMVQPRMIIAVGAHAASWFLGPVKMDMVRGVPVQWSYNDFTTIVFPIYHPAAALRNDRLMAKIYHDLCRAKTVLDGNDITSALSLDANYILLKDVPKLTIDSVIAVDTETVNDEPWCLSFSIVPGTAYVVMSDNTPVLQWLASIVANNQLLTILHNALFDLAVLEKMGIVPTNYIDTMVMAYLLQTEPQGLKPLAYRHLGIKMQSYSDVVAPATYDKAVTWLKTIRDSTWADVAPIKKWETKPKKEQLYRTEFVSCTAKKKGAMECYCGKDSTCTICNGSGYYYTKRVKDGVTIVPGTEYGYWKESVPTNISKRAERIIKDVEEGKDVDIIACWNSVGLDEGRAGVELSMGVIPQGTLADIPREKAIEYSARDADMTLQVYYKLLPLIYERSLVEALNIDTAVIAFVHDMNKSGIKLDLDELQRIDAEVITNLSEVTNRIYKEVGHSFNISSPKQKAEVLHELGLFDSSNASTGKNELKKLEDSHAVIKLLLKHSELEKLRSAFTGTLGTKIRDDGRIYPNVKTTRTETGRFAYSNPNLQQIPSRSELGKSIRGAFVAEEGNVLIASDYGQIEMRIPAHLAKDKNLVQMFNDGVDVHTRTAAMIWGISEDEVLSNKDKYRTPIKTIAFGILYGAGAEKLSKNLGKPLDFCENLITEWFKVNYGIKQFVDSTHAFALQNGYVCDVFGRRRYLTQVWSTKRGIVNGGLRQSVNTIIQSSAAGLLKIAEAKLVSIYRSSRLFKPILSIHDEIVVEAKEEHAEEVKLIVESIMMNAMQLIVPLEVEAKIGKSWKEIK